MRLRIVFTALSLLMLQVGFSQSQMEKADKEYELYAFDRAVKSYLKAINAEGYTPETVARLADSYRNLNQPEKAAKWYKKAVEAGSISPKQIFNYGQVLMTLQRYDEAGQWFTVYAGTDPVAGNKYVENCSYAKSRMADPAAYKVTNLNLNTKTSDFSPAFYGSKLVFASARTDIQKSKSAKTWTGNAQNRLFSAQGVNSGNPSSVSLLHAELRNAFNEGPISFSPDGSLVAFTKNNFITGTRQIPSGGAQMSIFIGEVINGDWTASKAFIHNTVGSNTGYPAFSPDGKSLYFASDRPGGFGGYDIYVCYNYGDSWSAPENLGATVNSKGNEISPFFDGTDLTFSSDWHSGFGGYDIFRAEKSNLSWDRVYHLGTNINSSYDDYGYVFDKKQNRGYLTSNRFGGKGAEDIYGAKLVSNQIVLSVTNSADGAPIAGATIDLSNCGLNKIKTDAAGKIKLETVEGINCSVEIEMPDFLKESIQINTHSGKKDYKIALRKESDLYRSQVFSSVDNLPLADVTVKATNRSSGLTTSVKTDNKGQFSMVFAPGTNYNLRYSKAGFLEINQTLRTGDGTDKNLLKSVRLTPTGLLGGATYVSKKETKSPKAKASTKSVPAPPAATDKASNTPLKVNESMPSANNGEGYAIQIFSLKTTDAGATDELKSKYGDIGDVYTKKVDGLIKVRVGIFENKEVARQAQTKLQAKGIETSFIIPDIHPLRLKEKEASATPPKKITTTAKGSDTIYKVRLAAYKNPKWFEESKVSGLGNIERIRNGEVTIIVLSGFANKWEAKKGMQKARELGFEEAYVFNYENGVMKRAE